MSAPTPASTPASIRPKALRERASTWMPLAVTVLLHVLLIGGAAAIVVQQSSLGKKKTFEAAAATDMVATKQVEHRLQVARRGGASGGATNPVSANRIFSTANGAVQMPEMPELPSMGAGGFGGFGGMGSGVGMGAGTGMATSLGGGTGLGGRGFMSLNFLGMTSQNASNVVFVVDTGAGIMDLRKGGFRAFTIIREEIMRLVGRLPPSARFNVILFGSGSDLNLFGEELVPATSANKKEFFDWVAPVNQDHAKLGPYSAARRTAWRKARLPADSGVDPDFLPPIWSHGLRAALEQKGDVVFVITSTAGVCFRRVDEATVAKRRAEIAKRKAELEKQGIDIAAVQAARHRSDEKARREFAEANRKLVAAGRDPIVITDTVQIFAPHVQAALRRAGVTIVRDLTGWTDKDGRPINLDGIGFSDVEGASWNEFHSHVARLQKAFVPKRASVHTLLFVGPDDKAEDQAEILSAVAKRNDGKFQLLTTKRLEEFQADAGRGEKAG